MTTPEPCTTRTQTRLHWSTDLRDSFGARYGTTLCGEDAYDQVAAESDSEHLNLPIVDIATELPPCVMCAALVAESGHGNGQKVDVHIQYASLVLRDGQPSTPLDMLPWGPDRTDADRRVAWHEQRKAEQPGWLGSAVVLRRYVIATTPEEVPPHRLGPDGEWSILAG